MQCARPVVWSVVSDLDVHQQQGQLSMRGLRYQRNGYNCRQSSLCCKRTRLPALTRAAFCLHNPLLALHALVCRCTCTHTHASALLDAPSL